jgi:hypothetical protein
MKVAYHLGNGHGKNCYGNSSFRHCSNGCFRTRMLEQPRVLEQQHPQALQHHHRAMEQLLRQQRQDQLVQQTRTTSAFALRTTPRSSRMWTFG